MLRSMASSSPTAAVCIIRVESEPWGLIITVTVNRDIARARTEPPAHFHNIGAAVAAVAEFLESFSDETQSE
jgi:hypothetical protein